MHPTTLHLDEKYRLLIPKSVRTLFPEGMVYGGLRTHALLIGPEPYKEIGAYANTMDDSGRLPIGKDLLSISGVPIDTDTKLNQVFWLPYTVRNDSEFILFFGATGEQTWRNILATKTAVNPLVLTTGN